MAFWVIGRTGGGISAELGYTVIKPTLCMYSLCNCVLCVLLQLQICAAGKPNQTKPNQTKPLYTKSATQTCCPNCIPNHYIPRKKSVQLCFVRVVAVTNLCENIRKRYAPATWHSPNCCVKIGGLRLIFCQIFFHYQVSLAGWWLHPENTQVCGLDCSQTANHMHT